MLTLQFKSHFLRKFKKMRQKNPSLKKRVKETLELLKVNPIDPKLGSHKVIAKLDGKPAISSKVTRDLRIIWRWDNDRISILHIIDIGGHSGKKKVYV